jgi:hypothetical protein
MKNVILIGIIVCLFFLINEFRNNSENDDDKAFEAFNSVIERTSKKIKNKYHFTFIGNGGGSKDDKLWFIGLSFKRFGPVLDITEGRKLLVIVAKDFLKEANKDKNLANYFNPFPFTEKNIELKIFISDLDGNDVFDPNLAIITLVEGNISYVTINKDGLFKSRIKESYIDALKIVNDNHQLRLSN